MNISELTQIVGPINRGQLETGFKTDADTEQTVQKRIPIGLKRVENIAKKVGVHPFTVYKAVGGRGGSAELRARISGHLTAQERKVIGWEE